MSHSICLNFLMHWLSLYTTAETKQMKLRVQTMLWIADQRIHWVLHHIMCIFMNLWSVESRVKTLCRILRDELKREFTTSQIDREEEIFEDIIVFWFSSSQKILKQYLVHWEINYQIDCRSSYLSKILYKRMLETNS